QVIVLLERGANELLQLRILENLPPGQVGIRGCLNFGLRIRAEVVECRWSLNGGPMVVGTNHAASEQAGGRNGSHPWNTSVHTHLRVIASSDRCDGLCQSPGASAGVAGSAPATCSLLAPDHFSTR